MHLMYVLNEEGKRIYSLKKVIQGRVAQSAHPARFSPDDKYAYERLRLQQRFAALRQARKYKHLEDIAFVKKMVAEKGVSIEEKEEDSDSD